jgi:hypothetical protein
VSGLHEYGVSLALVLVHVGVDDPHDIRPEARREIEHEAY